MQLEEMAAASRYPKRESRRGKLRPRRMNAVAPVEERTRSPRLVVIKAKQQLASKRVDAATKNVLLRQLPQTHRRRRRGRNAPDQTEATVLPLEMPLPVPCVLLRTEQRPKARHSYLLRSRSVRSESRELLSVEEVQVVKIPCASSQAPCLKQRPKSTTSSRDSGIDSAASTSDSEDSNVSGCESAASDLISVPRPALVAHVILAEAEKEPFPEPVASCSHSHSADDDLDPPRPEKTTRTEVLVTKTCTTASGAAVRTEYSFTSVSDNFLNYGNEDMPDFLQDIDDVISADTVRIRVEEQQKEDGSKAADVSMSGPECASVTHELSLCHEQLGDSTLDVVMEKSTYVYNASAGELEFVDETTVIRETMRMTSKFTNSLSSSNHNVHTVDAPLSQHTQSRHSTGNPPHSQSVSPPCRRFSQISRYDLPFGATLRRIWPPSARPVATEIFRGVQRIGQALRPAAVLPPKTRSCPKYTLILDLDETLVHCFTNDPPDRFDHHFSVKVPDQCGSGETTELAVFARLRPFVKEFLERMAKKFEVVVFTASMKSYSSKMLDLLDPEGVLIKHRFYRDHCVPVGCSFVKDLSIFTRDLSKLIIVDNQIASFAFQIENGVPIRSWIGDDDDRELLYLAEYLEKIADNEDLDVRQHIRETLRIPAQLENHVHMYYATPFNAGLSSIPWAPPTPPPSQPTPAPNLSSPIFSCVPDHNMGPTTATLAVPEILRESTS